MVPPQVTIEIGDVNDHAPRFRDASTVVSVRESVSPGTSLALPVAVDVDSPEYGVRAYELLEDEALQQSTGGAFSLSIVSRRDGSLDPRLVLQRPLDRERRATYRLRLAAYDGGRPPKSAQVGAVTVDAQRSTVTKPR